MLPHDAAQATDALALNSCVSPAGVAALVGVITRGVVTVAVVDAKVPVEDFAVTVQGPAFNGAVYRPPEVMVPHFAVYVAVLFVLNCTVDPSCTVGFSGEIANVEGAATLS